MNQKFVNSLAVSLLIATLGTLTTGNASYSEGKPQNANQSVTEKQGAETDQTLALSQPTKTATGKRQPPLSPIEKVGEQKNPLSAGTAKTIAKVYAHQQSGRKAATLYVRNIPILTFVANEAAAESSTKLGTQLSDVQVNKPASARTKALDNTVEDSLSLSTSSLQKHSTFLKTSDGISSALDAEFSDKVPEPELATTDSDPTARATAVAAKINQLYRDDVNGKDITLEWEHATGTASGRYLIKASKVEITAIDSDTILPDTTHNLEHDALQATNRLRRLFGDAAPLNAIAGKAAFDPQLAFSGIIQRTMTGFASWYGPGFHGNRSASGEIFNQHAMTAAHRTLPFGTRVVVTNLDNGQSVVVKINDRGPFHGNRVIDLSAGAAQVLGLVQSGIAPVRVEVLAPDTTASN